MSAQTNKAPCPAPGHGSQFRVFEGFAEAVLLPEWLSLRNISPSFRVYCKCSGMGSQLKHTQPQPQPPPPHKIATTQHSNLLPSAVLTIQLSSPQKSAGFNVHAVESEQFHEKIAFLLGQEDGKPVTETVGLLCRGILSKGPL